MLAVWETPPVLLIHRLTQQSLLSCFIETCKFHQLTLEAEEKPRPFYFSTKKRSVYVRWHSDLLSDSLPLPLCLSSVCARVYLRVCFLIGGSVSTWEVGRCSWNVAQRQGKHTASTLPEREREKERKQSNLTHWGTALSGSDVRGATQGSPERNKRESDLSMKTWRLFSPT